MQTGKLGADGDKKCVWRSGKAKKTGISGKKQTNKAQYLDSSHFYFTFAPANKPRRGARVVEEARLESVYTPKAYHGFESRFLRPID